MSLQERVEVPGSHREAATGASSPKPLDNSEIVDATVVLRRQARATMPKIEEFGYRPAHTRSYHTRDEFAVLHGADAADIAAVEAFAHESGLTVKERSAG